MRLIPVHWIMAAFNVVTWLYDATAYVFERIFSFGNSLVWNLTGYDQYYVFQDNCPTPIPYRAYMLGGTGRYKWYYNARTHEFEAWIEGAKKQFLPALSINIRQDYTSEDGPNNRYEYDLTRWLDTVKFKTTDDFFPHPMQLVSAWSLHSGIWPSFVTASNKTTRITMMSGMDGESYDIDVSTTISRFRWREFVAGTAGNVSSDESESEATESESEATESTESEATKSDSESEAESTESEATESDSESDAESEAEECDRKSVTCESNSKGEDDSKSVTCKSDTESDVSKSATSASIDENQKVDYVVSEKALFLAGGTDEIPTWSADWTIMPSSFTSFMSTMQLYGEVGLPPYTPVVNPDMEAVD